MGRKDLAMKSASLPALARRKQPRRRFAAVLLAVPAAVGVMPGGKITAARADEYTTSQDTLRDGWDQAEPGLSPSVVSTSSFGQRFATKVNGQVFAQPLVVGSTVIVATENDSVYGINTVTGVVQWSRSLGTPYHITTCGNIAPNIGVTGGPVYDPAVTTLAPHGLVLTVAQIVYNGSLRYRLFMLDPVTGAQLATKFITGSPVNDSSLTFNAGQLLERPGLLLMNGWVYAAFGSHCDHKPYVGYVAGVNVATEAVTLWTDESGVTGNQAGIWQSGGGLMSDGPGRIFITSGNGVSPPARAGTSPPGQLAESVVRLAVGSTGTLSAKDFFSPANAPTLDAADTDFGSGGPTGLPFGTSTYPATNVGSSGTQAVTATASSDVTVTGVSAQTTTSNLPSSASQFTAGRAAVTPAGSGTGSPASFPVTLHTGDKITVPVTFKPAVPGGVTGTLSFATPSASLPSTDVPLAGQGLSTGLYADAPAVQFALVGDHGQFLSWVPANISVPREMTITNGSAVPQRITSVSGPGGPFRAEAAVLPGLPVNPSDDLTIRVGFTPPHKGRFSTRYQLVWKDSSGTHIVTVPITGTGV